MFESIEKELLSAAGSILNEIGLDVETATRMMLKKIVREESIAFLLPENQTKSVKYPTPDNDHVIKMTKNKAMSLFRQQDFVFSKNTTFASKNNSTHIYWANPNIAVLSEDWHLILNDWETRELHLFFIKSGTLDENALKRRKDYDYLIDLQISPGDPTFTDNRSKLSFLPFKEKTIKY